MNGLGFKVAQSRALSHGTDVGIRLFERRWQRVAEVVLIHPSQAMLKDDCCAVMAALDGPHGGVQGGSLAGAPVDCTVQNVVVVKDGLARFEGDAKLAWHAVALGIVDGDVSFVGHPGSSVGLWNYIQTLVFIQGALACC